MENLPVFISLLFGLTTILTVWIFYKATGNSKLVLLLITIWMVLQTFIAISGFYTQTNTVPPRFLLLVLPPALLITSLFISTRGKNFIDNLNLRTLTLLHTMRIPVEVVLFLLFVNKAIPELMTFEGRNFDILSGITAPFIFYFAFIRKKMHHKTILIWNIICLVLLVNIVANAILSAPSQFQQFAFDQPNIALIYFPFIWLPCCIVPLVVLSHLAAIRQLSKFEKNNLS